MGESYIDILKIQRQLREHKLIIDKFTRGDVGGGQIGDISSTVILNEIKMIKDELVQHEKLLDSACSLLIKISDQVEELLEKGIAYPHPDITPIITSESNNTGTDSRIGFEDALYIPEVNVDGSITDFRVKDNNTTVEDGDFTSILDSLDKLNNEE